MDDIRFKRYFDKIAYIQDKLQYFIPNASNDLEKNGILYCVQTSIEASIDTIAMIIKDLGYDVKSDKENIRFLVEKDIINPELGIFFEKANGLRNLLVHRYNGIEEARIFQEIEIIKKYLLVWIDKLEYLINEIRNNQSDSK
ncbi:MAG: DUF86 domain-containing protein [Candidatus Lokiarchaeota archaeon]|nr:DUF86 domain-containing protein [Candidatus Harpocratesius repetitus]